MKLEYLFSGDEIRNELESYKFDLSKKANNTKKIEIKKEIYDIEGSNKWILSFVIDGNNETNARYLSDINDSIMKYDPLVLSNESAEYFNKSIYPLINEFERKIRKYLYLRISVYNENTDEEKKIVIDNKCDKNENDDKKKSKDNKNRLVISRLESLEFGELYTTLFTDKNVISTFNQRVKSRISSKEYYMQVLSEINEVTIWDTIRCVNENDCIKKDFLTITDYRNDAMHAHNITYSDYCKQKELFKEVNSFLDTEIKTIIKQPSNVELTQNIASVLYDRTIPETLRTYIGDIDKVDFTNNQIKNLTDLAESLNSNFSSHNNVQENIEQEWLTNLKAFSNILQAQFIAPNKTFIDFSKIATAFNEIKSMQYRIPSEALKNLTSSLNELKPTQNSIPDENRKTQQNSIDSNKTFNQDVPLVELQESIPETNSNNYIEDEEENE